MLEKVFSNRGRNLLIWLAPKVRVRQLASGKALKNKWPDGVKVLAVAVGHDPVPVDDSVLHNE